MSLAIVHEPIPTDVEIQAGPIGQRQSQFRSSWDDTRLRLSAELGHLGADEVTIQLDVLPGDIRVDGSLRRDARVRSARARVVFDSDRGLLAFLAVQYRDDRAGRAAWRANVHAVALTLESLRAVDRYGVDTGGAQYEGFRAALPSGHTASESAALETLDLTDRNAASYWLARVTGIESGLGAQIRAARRLANTDAEIGGRLAVVERTLAAADSV